MPRPDADPLAAQRPHALGDQIERLVPRRLAEGVVATRADEGMEQARRIADDLVGSLAAYAQEPLAVRVVGVAPHPEHAAVLDVDQHAAQRGMTVHRTHRPHGSQPG